MKVITTFVLLTVISAAPKPESAEYGFVRYDDDAGAFSISLPSGYTLSKGGDYPRYFSWTDEDMGLAFVSANWAGGTNLTTDEVKQAYENLLGVESDLGARKTIIPDDLLAVYGADDGLRGRYDVADENEEMRYRVSFFKRRDRVYTFIIATPVALEEGILDVVNTIRDSVILQGGNGP